MEQHVVKTSKLFVKNVSFIRLMKGEQGAKSVVLKYEGKVNLDVSASGVTSFTALKVDVKLDILVPSVNPMKFGLEIDIAKQLDAIYVDLPDGFNIKMNNILNIYLTESKFNDLTHLGGSLHMNGGSVDGELLVNLGKHPTSHTLFEGVFLARARVNIEGGKVVFDGIMPGSKVGVHAHNGRIDIDDTRGGVDFDIDTISGDIYLTRRKDGKDKSKYKCFTHVGDLFLTGIEDDLEFTKTDQVM